MKADQDEEVLVMAKNFNELRTKMSPGAQKRARQKADMYREQMALDELREARRITQEHLAKTLRVKQASISKMERRADMYVSTLQSFVQALGGRLMISAIFPEGTVEITQFRALANDKFKVKTA